MYFISCERCHRQCLESIFSDEPMHVSLNCFEGLKNFAKLFFALFVAD